MLHNAKILLIPIWLFVVLFHPVVHGQDKEAKVVALTNVTLIDVESSKVSENATIVIEGELIKAIYLGRNAKVSEAMEVLDLTGTYVIPGLIDAHVHLFRPQNRKEILKELLYSGVTSVRDMGGDVRVYQKLTKEIAEGIIEGPGIYYAATFFGPEFLKDPRTKFAAQGFEPGEAPWMRAITEETDLTKAIAEAAEQGVTGIKLYSSIEPELVGKIVQEANRQALKVWSHSSIFPSRPSDAVNAGVNVLSHALGMIGEIGGELPDSFLKSIQEFIPKQDFKSANENAREFRELFMKMKSQGILFEPTLSAWHYRSPTQGDVRLLNNGDNPKAHMSRAAQSMDLEAVDEWSHRITRSAYEHGVTIVAGTDLSESIKWVQDETKYLTGCGLSEMDALRAATINAARAIGIEKTHGSIAVGKRADLVVLSEDPLSNIDHLKKVRFVMKSGKTYRH